MRILATTFAVWSLSFVLHTGSASAQPILGTDQQSVRVALVDEFLREMEVLYRLQETAKTETAADPSTNGKLMTGIRMSTRTILAMTDSINRLDMVPVTGQWLQFRDLLKSLDQSRIGLAQQVAQTAKIFLSGPQAGVNYGALVAHAPELTAQVEELDKNLFTMSKAMFFALVDERRVAADGNLHHLILTKAQRSSMKNYIDEAFGRSLDDPKSSYVVSAAWAIEYGLTRPIYKAADEQ